MPHVDNRDNPLPPCPLRSPPRGPIRTLSKGCIARGRLEQPEVTLVPFGVCLRKRRSLRGRIVLSAEG